MLYFKTKILLDLHFIFSNTAILRGVQAMNTLFCSDSHPLAIPLKFLSWMVGDPVNINHFRSSLVV